MPFRLESCESRVRRLRCDDLDPAVLRSGPLEPSVLRDRRFDRLLGTEGLGLVRKAASSHLGSEPSPAGALCRPVEAA